MSKNLKISKKIKKIFFGCSVFLFLFLPWHAFLTTWQKMPAWWKEGLIALMFGLLGILYIINPEKRQQINQRIYQWRWWLMSVIWLVGYSLVLFLVNQQNLSQWLWGARTDWLGFAVFFLFLLSGFSNQERDGLIKVLFISAIFVILIGIVQFLFPRAFLWFGYSENISSWTPGLTSLPVFHGLSGSSSLIRINSTFSSPNHLAAFLLIIIALYEYWFRLINPKKQKFWFGVYFCAIVLVLILTFSRSAILGLALMGGLYFWFKKKPGIKISQYTLATGSVALLSALFVFGYFGSAGRFVSTSEHWFKFKEGLKIFFAHPFGLGLWEAGPVSVRFDPNYVGIITENWFLQIAIEVGIIWLIFYLFAYCFIAFELWQAAKAKDDLSFLLLLAYGAITVMACFLHIWESSQITVVGWGLMGMALQSQKKVKSQK